MNTEQVRSNFEKINPGGLARRDNGDYVSEMVQSMWIAYQKAWQASRGALVEMKETQQEKGKRLFAEISNQVVGEGGEPVGYFVPNKRMDELEKLLSRSLVVQLPTTRYWAGGIDVYEKRDVIEALRSAGITVRDER